MSNDFFERRNAKPKPRKTGQMPAEKLLETLKKIYPQEQAEEIFRNLQSKEAEE